MGLLHGGHIHMDWLLLLLLMLLMLTLMMIFFILHIFSDELLTQNHMQLF